MHVPTGEIHQLTEAQMKAFKHEMSADDTALQKLMADQKSKMAALTDN